MRLAVILIIAIAVLGCAAEATENPPVGHAAATNGIEGTVLETFDASSYTYVRFETADGEAWAAVPQAQLEVGEQIAIANPQTMSNFESKALGRTFDTIYFGTLAGAAAGPAAVAQASAEPIEVAKAEGADGRTVAQLHAERGALSGKTVTLRGKVVKYNAGIMGRNWIHLQDGSGDAAAGTHDITVTTADTTEVGATVLVQGTATLDKDFGSGYFYEIIVEDASVK